ncbi:MAG TPA: peptidyl-prolyl cis-trans isomerase [Pararhizobium sp.]|nr:peptidyl-prolyl cis-trans isomerase [Pararhizobium sp.]
MFDLLRRGAQTWPAKLLMLILVVSFGVWGISGELFSGGGGNSVIKVGSVKVTPTEFRLAYNREIGMLSQQLGTRLTTQQAKAFGVEQRVFAQLASGAALDQLANNMNLGLSQDQLAQFIAEDPAFHDSSGNFNRDQFNQVLANVGMSQKDYIANRSHVAERSQIIDAVGKGFKPPVTLVNAILQHQGESRDVEYLLISKESVPAVNAPSDKELQAFFDKHKSAYRAPEYRKIAYVTLTPKDIADPAAVSDADAKQYYEEHKNQYGTPETRTIDQLVFSDQKAAEAAEQKLKSGTSFDELAKEQGKKPSDTRLGTYTKANFPAPNLADAAFSVKQAGGTTGIVDGPFGPVILRVSKIEPAHVKSFAEVEKDVRQELAVEQAASRINDVQNAYEDARAGGATLQEAARKEGLKPVVVDAIDAEGTAPDGKQVKGLPDKKDLLQAAFSNGQGEEIPSLNLGSNGYLWVEVLSVNPAHDRTLKEVHDKVVADWTADQVKQEISKKAAAVKKEVDGGKSLKQVATDLGTALETKQGIKRNTTDAVFGQDAAAAAFGGPKGLVALADAANGPGKLVLHVTGVQAATQSGYDAVPAQALDSLANRTTNDIFGQMVAMLEQHYGVSVNQNLAEQAISQY